jgi:hypothetical protein
MRTHDYVFAISTDNLRTAITEAGDILSDLLDESLRTGSESEGQSTLELQRALARHREEGPQGSNSDSLDLDDDDEGAELVE